MTLSIILNLDRSGYDRLEAAAALHTVDPEELVRHAAMYTMADLDEGRATPDALRSSAAQSPVGGHTLVVGLSDFGFDRVSEAAEQYGMTLQEMLRGALAYYLEEAAVGRSAAVVPLVVPAAVERGAGEPVPDAVVGSGQARRDAARRGRASRRRLAASRAGSLAAAALAAAASAVLILELPGRDGRPPTGIPVEVRPPLHSAPPEAGALSALPVGRGLTTATVRVGSDARRARPPVVATPHAVGQPAPQTGLVGLTPTIQSAQQASTAGATQALRAAESGVPKDSGRHGGSKSSSSKATANQRQSRSRQRRRARHRDGNHKRGAPKSAGIARSIRLNKSQRRHVRQARHEGRQAHRWLRAALKPQPKGDHHGRRGAASDKGHGRSHHGERKQDGDHKSKQDGDHKKHSAKANDGGHRRKAGGRAQGHGHRHGGHKSK